MQEELLCTCKNNYAFYIAERQRRRNIEEMKIDLQDKKDAHKLAEYASGVAQSERASRYREPYEWEDTYAWVLWHFAGVDEEAIKKACKIVDELKARTTIPFEWRQKLDERYEELFKLGR